MDSWEESQFGDSCPKIRGEAAQGVAQFLHLREQEGILPLSVVLHFILSLITVNKNGETQLVGS